MTEKPPLGFMANNPKTGECFAAFSDNPLPDESAELMGQNAIVERRPLAEVKEAFCEVHPSRRVALLGPSIGQYLGRDIPAWYETADGQRREYAGICGPQPDFDTLETGQSVLAPGLLYQEVDRDGK